MLMRSETCTSSSQTKTPEVEKRELFGKLKETMYGTLDAAERWGEHYVATLTKAGFSVKPPAPAIFTTQERISGYWCTVMTS